MELKICHLYPDLLNLYGDRGNVICMKKRLEWRGIDCRVEKLPIGTSESLAGFDLVFLGSGQDFDRQVLLDDLRRGKAAEIKAAIEDGVTFLAISGGFRLLGNYHEDSKGNKTDYIGAVDLYTVDSAERVTGNCKFVCSDEAGGSTVVGFENHSGLSYIDSGAKPLGTVLSGFGNNGRDKTEGVLYKNVFGTYSHGPVLPKNPEFCDHILLRALKRKYGKVELQPLDDSAELHAHREMSTKL